ncbi:hypothetical protein AGLY_006980 [Aphis glycines]|uniref:Uncharacterized protein n=1 Tax=Aphis glycines TaxID=307491 RepID=A0A6G0TPR7_APHGL|nr:hypothetical protein AGLY_006980 [Aphis glycines]
MLQFQTLGVVYDGKVNILGPWCIIEIKSKHFPTVSKKIESNFYEICRNHENLQKNENDLNYFNLIDTMHLWYQQIVTTDSRLMCLEDNVTYSQEILRPIQMYFSSCLFLLTFLFQYSLPFRNRRYSHFFTSYHDHTLKIEDITIIRHHYNNDNIDYLIANLLSQLSSCVIPDNPQRRLKRPTFLVLKLVTHACSNGNMIKILLYYLTEMNYCKRRKT